MCRSYSKTDCKSFEDHTSGLEGLHGNYALLAVLICIDETLLIEGNRWKASADSAYHNYQGRNQNERHQDRL